MTLTTTMEGHATNGLELVDELNINLLDAPKQVSPSTGLRDIFHVDKKRLSRSE